MDGKRKPGRPKKKIEENPKPKRRGRPPRKDKAQILARVFAEMSENGMSFVKAAELAGVPYGTITAWVSETQEIQQEYARAKELCAEIWIDKLREQAYNPAILNPSTQAVDNGDIQLRKLRIDTDKWILSKMLPRKYGDKLELETPNLNCVPPSPFTPEQLRKMADIQEALEKNGDE